MIFSIRNLGFELGSLLLEGWFEPPMAHGVHLSTLVQQMLS